MYFNSKSDTNIDKNFKDNNKLSIKDLWNKFKLYIFIFIALIILAIVIVFLIKNKKPNNNDNNTGYTITLEGDKNITIYQDSEYVESGYHGFDKNNNDVTNKIDVHYNLDTSIIGEYQITYTLYDATEYRNITIIEKPKGATYIHLIGDEVIYLKLNEEYIEPGYIVIDTVDSNLTKQVSAHDNINNKEAGVYKVTYTVTNSSGITTTTSRKVIIMDSNTSISLDNTEYTNKDVGINIHIVDNYFDYIVLPNNEKITDKNYVYKVSENGTYKFIIYTKKGSPTEESISVSNINKTIPTGSCTGYSENGKSYITVNAKDDIGISKYIVDDISSTSNNITINKELTKASVTVYDKAGNSTNISCNLEEKSIKYNAETTLKKCNATGCKHQYWLNVPSNAKSNMPLIISLHGSNETNKPNDVKNLPINKFVINEYQGEPFIYIAPVAGSGGWWSETLPEQLKILIDEVVSNYKIDTSRIYLTGFSMGARASWNLVDNYPNFFAAAVPISYCPSNNNSENNFKATKIRAFCGSKETSYTSCIKKFVNKINNVGGFATSEEIEGKNHSGMQKALDYNEIFTWMLKQKKEN